MRSGVVGKYLLLLLGVFTGATSVLMIKQSTLHPVPLASYRMLLAAAMLAPLFLRDLRRRRGEFTRVHLRRTLLPGVLLGAHFIAWIFGARMTLMGNANLIVNLVPVAMPFLLYFLARERLSAGELWGTLAALAGVTVLAGGDYRLEGTIFAGDIVCFVAMTLFAAYLALGRRNRDFPTIWLYIVPLHFFGGTVCFLAALAAGCDVAIRTWNDLAMAIGLAAIPTVLGHTIYNAAMKWFRGQVVSVTGLSQFIFGAALGWLFLREAPTWNFYLAAVLVVSGAIVALRATLAAVRRLESSAPVHTGPPAADDPQQRA